MNVELTRAEVRDLIALTGYSGGAYGRLSAKLTAALERGQPVPVLEPMVSMRLYGLTQIGPEVLFEHMMSGVRGSNWQEQFIDGVYIDRVTVAVH